MNSNLVRLGPKARLNGTLWRRLVRSRSDIVRLPNTAESNLLIDLDMPSCDYIAVQCKLTAKPIDDVAEHGRVMRQRCFR